jgi:hypothetical protein
MNSLWIQLTLCAFVAQASLAQVNPSSSNSHNAAASVTVTGIFISSYHEDDQEDYTIPTYVNSAGYVYPGYTYSDVNFTDWVDGCGGAGQYMFHNSAAVKYCYRWPAASFPQPLPSGTEVFSYPGYPDIPPITNTCSAPYLAQEHCRFTVGESLFSPSKMTRAADASLILATGGSAGSTSMRTWVITASATEHSLPWVLGGGHGGWENCLTDTPISPDNISIAGNTLNNDGFLLLTLPDDVEIDITPNVCGIDYYTFTVQAIPVDITIKKQGDNDPPATGVDVKKGDTLSISLFGNSETPITTGPSQPTWKYRQMKSDGTYTDWQLFGATGVGAVFDYTTSKSGIFQVEAVFYGNDANAAKYVRKKDESPLGRGLKGQPDSFGVCDTQTQLNIRNEALSFLGSTAYRSDKIVPAQYGFSMFGTNKNEVMRCNIFVAHRCCAVGATVPAINGIFHDYPPTANQWAGVESASHIYFTTAISGWPLLGSNTFPQPGWIIAHPDASDAGHCAIIDYDGGGIGSGMTGTVNKNYEEFYDGTSRYRSFTP